jgi:hypothetical protein
LPFPSSKCWPGCLVIAARSFYRVTRIAREGLRLVLAEGLVLPL